MKSKIVDAFEIRDRWIEEVALVKTEMANFLRYYSDVRIPALQKDIAILEEELKSGGWFKCLHSKAVTFTPLLELSLTCLQSQIELINYRMNQCIAFI